MREDTETGKDFKILPLSAIPSSKITWLWPRLSAILNTFDDNLSSLGHSALIFSFVHFYLPNPLPYFIFHLFTQFLSHVLSCETKLHPKEARTKGEKVKCCVLGLLSEVSWLFCTNIRFVSLFFPSYSLSTELTTLPITQGSPLTCCLADSPALVNQVCFRWWLAIYQLPGKMYFNHFLLL